MPALLLAHAGELTRRANVKGSPAYLAENNAPAILTLVGVFGGLSLVTVCLRIYVRQFMLKGVTADDIVIFVAMLMGIALFGCFCGQVNYGLGRHYEALTLDDQQGFQRIQFWSSLLVTSAITPVKVSISLLLIKLVNNKHLIRFLYVFIGLICAYTIASDLTIVLACRPVDAAWDFSKMPTAKCFSTKTFSALGIANSVVTICTDVLLALLPVPIVWKLQTDLRTKVALIGVLVLGLVAVAAGAVKVNAQLTFFSIADRFYKNEFPVWAALELYIAIIAATLPTLRPLMCAFFNGVRSTIGSSSGRTKKTTQQNTGGRSRPRGYHSRAMSTTCSRNEMVRDETGSQEGLVLTSVSGKHTPALTKSTDTGEMDEKSKDNNFIVRTTHIQTTKGSSSDSSPNASSFGQFDFQKR
ncbi:hypothetical protein KVT40_004216 [Elsinoe batatas]|uniref:Rhodopsin domain-containing protein n=1 Tax=Elsinoe batatas TaxID=2601811 RepID=A0A8K0L9U5_9PEZI|nr:hypothetical protein KVT40_004216 [Elsinoe batatas]